MRLMHRSVFKHFVFLLGILVFNTSLLQAQSCVCGTKKPRSAERIATSQLYLARQARDAGDMPKAELLWRDAVKCTGPKHFVRPAWLDAKPLAVSEPVMPSMEERLARIASLPYDLASMMLADILERDPVNIRARQLYLSMATKNDDRQQISRHSSVLTQTDDTGRGALLQYFVILLVLVLPAWQARGAVLQTCRSVSSRIARLFFL